MMSHGWLALMLLASVEPISVERETIDVEGWTVAVDKRLRHGEDEALGRRALGLLEGQLRVVALTLPEDKVKRLRKVKIHLDRSHGKLVSPQYHPSAGWLRGNGYDPKLAKGVHIPDAVYFSRARFQHHQPSALLHELAHAYHDQELSFDDAEIRRVWKAVADSGRFDAVRHVDGENRKHYATTNPQEFFAEMTEAYLGHNDFFPFNAGELKSAEPEVFKLMERTWGKLP